MRGARWSEHLATLIGVLIVAAHLVVATILVYWRWGSGQFEEFGRTWEWQFAVAATFALIGVAVLSARHWSRPHDPDVVLLLVAFPAFSSIVLASAAWLPFLLEAPAAREQAASGLTRLIPLALAALGILLGVGFHRRSFLAFWLAALGALVATSPLLRALLPRTGWWDARMLVLPLGVIVILHFSRGWPFALPEGHAWKVLVGLLGALWVLPPLLQLYRAGEAPAPPVGWLIVMGLLNWVVATLLVAFPLYGWRFGWEWVRPDSEPRPYPWPGIFLLMLTAAVLTARLLPALPPVLLATAPAGTASSASWVDWVRLARPFTISAGLLTIPYLLTAGPEELSIWTYRRRQARLEAAEQPAARPAP